MTKTVHPVDLVTDVNNTPLFIVADDSSEPFNGKLTIFPRTFYNEVKSLVQLLEDSTKGLMAPGFRWSDLSVINMIREKYGLGLSESAMLVRSFIRTPMTDTKNTIEVTVEGMKTVFVSCGTQDTPETIANRALLKKMFSEGNNSNPFWGYRSAQVGDIFSFSFKEVLYRLRCEPVGWTPLYPEANVQLQ